MEIKGIDVSKYQGNIDWQKVKNAGYNFAFIRVGYCNDDGSINEDSYFKTNMNNATKAGVNVGCYVYSYAKSFEAGKNCANIVAEKIKPYKISMPIAFDIEDNSHAALGKSKNAEICKGFLNRIKELGYYPIIYTYTNFANSYIDMNALSNFDTWIADYRGYVGYKGKYTIWQHSSKGSVPGISGNCDLNIAYVDYLSIINNGGDGGTVENLSVLRYRVLKENKCQAFGSKNVNNVVKVNGKDYLDLGDYKILSKENNVGEQGFYWCEIRLLDGKSAYVVYNLPDNRCEIIDSTRDVNVKDKIFNVIKPNKSQAFMSRNTYDIHKFGDSSYIPVGKYEAVTIDTEPHEEGLYWCQFRYNDGNSYYSVYNLSDGRNAIEDKPKEPDPEPEPEPTPKPEPEVEVTKEEFNELVKRTTALEKSLSSLKEEINSLTKVHKEDIQELNNRIDLVYDWIKSFQE